MATTKEKLLVLGIKANGHYLKQVAFMWGKLPSHAAVALVWWGTLSSLPLSLYSQQ